MSKKSIGAYDKENQYIPRKALTISQVEELLKMGFKHTTNGVLPSGKERFWTKVDNVKDVKVTENRAVITLTVEDYGYSTLILNLSKAQFIPGSHKTYTLIANVTGYYTNWKGEKPKDEKLPKIRRF